MSVTAKISQENWMTLKQAAKECKIPPVVFNKIITLVTGIPINRFCGSMLDYDQYGEIVVLLEKEAFKLRVRCDLSERPKEKQDV